MPLSNFGSILNFAEELEKTDGDMYRSFSGNPACSEFVTVFEQLAGEAGKNLKTVQRTRRENVTEMILENIEGLSREPYSVERGDPSRMTARQAAETALKMEDRAERFYTEASLRFKAQPEVSRALKTLAKKRAANRKKLENL